MKILIILAIIVIIISYYFLSNQPIYLDKLKHIKVDIEKLPEVVKESFNKYWEEREQEVKKKFTNENYDYARSKIDTKEFVLINLDNLKTNMTIDSKDSSGPFAPLDNVVINQKKFIHRYRMKYPYVFYEKKLYYPNSYDQDIDQTIIVYDLSRYLKY